MKLDFKVQKDDFGFFLSMYRILDSVEIRYETCKSISIILNFLESDLIAFFHEVLGSDENPKNNIMHFQDYETATKAVKTMRMVLKKGFATGNIFLSR